MASKVRKKKDNDKVTTTFKPPFLPTNPQYSAPPLTNVRGGEGPNLGFCIFKMCNTNGK